MYGAVYLAVPGAAYSPVYSAAYRCVYWAVYMLGHRAAYCTVRAFFPKFGEKPWWERMVRGAYVKLNLCVPTKFPH